ncbi:hypothetical protein [Kitasatospora sp. NPDC057015]|uniref:hypothetical protein n=1 Tax=Kitasatospora sp. NPDC057015 TaxID=3346001 RepID=UPI0036397665
MLERLMEQSVTAELHGYYGNVALPVEEVSRLGALPAIRRAARVAGGRPGWDTYTYLVDGLFIVRDRRRPSEEVRMPTAPVAARSRPA